MFSHFNKNHVHVLILLKLAEFFLCLPGTNSATERVFSLMNSIWTSDKTQLGVDNGSDLRQTMMKLLLSFLKCFRQNDLKKIHNSEIIAALLLIFKVRMTTVLS
jgi:hypothetical protein